MMEGEDTSGNEYCLPSLTRVFTNPMVLSDGYLSVELH